MKTKAIFEGVGTALITPMTEERIDHDSFLRLIDRQIEKKADALIICGTTGEGATISFDEKRELYENSRKITKNKIPLILGAGSNDTKESIKLCELSLKVGADAALCVTPYYNKGTTEGIFKHFYEISRVGIPIILYNVPSRTGVNLDIEIIKRLSVLDNIVGIKEATDSAERHVRLAELRHDICIYSGNDSLVYLNSSLGGCGVISVASNIDPKPLKAIIDLYRSGKENEALDMQLSLMPQIDALFSETNPAPIKYALSRLGLCSPDMRLPLSEPREATRQKIDKILGIL